MSLLFLTACFEAERMEPHRPSPPEVRQIELPSTEDALRVADAHREMAATGREVVLEVRLGAGVFDDWLTLGTSDARDNVHLRIVGQGAATVWRGDMDLRGPTVVVSDVVFEENSDASYALAVVARSGIALERVAFLDQRASTPGRRGTFPPEGVAWMTTKEQGEVALRDVSLVGYRGGWSPLRFDTPRGGTVSLTRVFVASTTRTPLSVGYPADVTVADSVFALPVGVEPLLTTQWPRGAVRIERSTLLLDAPDGVVLPGDNPQHLPAEWLPAQVVDSTILARGPARDREPGVVLERTEVRAAPAGDVDLDALRAHARALAPLDRATLEPLLGAGPPITPSASPAPPPPSPRRP